MLPGTTIGPYEILERIGSGGMGEVYRARDSRLEREVAIKSLPLDKVSDEKALARLRREARILASLQHSGIAQVYGLEEEQGRPFLVMELIRGETLQQRLDRGSLAVPEALSLAVQIARALVAAHERGAIHRDLKPANVMVGPDDTCKVLDFGLATVDAPEEQHDITSAGRVMGTAPYMSPEQVRGEELDARTDLWSFGVLLFELLTGKNPFRGRTGADTTSAILMVQPSAAQLPAGLPAAARELIGRCLVKDRQARIADARQVVALLEEARGGASDPSIHTGAASAFSSTAPHGEGHRSGEQQQGAVLRTLVAIDLVDSTGLVERLGDGRASLLMSHHDRVARDLLSTHEGQEVDKTDGFLLLFERPIQAVRYAMAYHRALHDLSAAEGVEVHARVGIHLGEVILRANASDEVARGAKPVEVEGLAKPVAARLMSVGLPGQTLLSSGAYDLAQRGAVGQADAQGLMWLAHGHYLLQGVERPVDIFEVGAPGLAPLAPPPDSAKVHRLGSGEHGAASSGASRVAGSAASLPVASGNRRQRRALIGGVALVSILVAAAVAWQVGTHRHTAAPARLEEIGSLVALPGQVHGAAEDDYLGEAVSRTLSSSLSGIPALVVKAPPSAAQVEAIGSDLHRIASAYAVDAVVTSSVEVVGPQLVLDLSVVASGTDDLLWSKTFRGSREGYLTLLDGAAEAIAGALKKARAPRVVKAERGSEQELELRRAEYLWDRYNNQHRPSDFEASRQAYESLWLAHPELIEAANNLAFLYLFHYEATGHKEELATADGWAAKSLAVNRSARALALQSAVLQSREAAPMDVLRPALESIRIDPEDQFALNCFASAVSSFSVELGRVGMEEDARLHPLYLYPPLNAAEMLINLQRPEDALAHIDQLLALEPGMPAALGDRIAALVMLGRLEEAHAGITGLRTLPAGAVPPGKLGSLAALLDHAEASRSNKGDTAAGSLAALRGLAIDGLWPYHPLVIIARSGKPAEVSLMLQDLMVARFPVPADMLLLNPSLARMKGDPTFDSLLASGRAGLREALVALDAARAQGASLAFLEPGLSQVRPLADADGRAGASERSSR